MSFLHSASYVNIERSNLTNIGRDQIILDSNNAPLFDMMKQHIVPDAAYNSKARQAEYATTCQAGTRERVLRDLTDWARRDDDQAVCWLYGPAGSGKSTIAHTIAEQCGDKLGASFFFSRGKGGRSVTTGLLPTLAYQLAARVPPLQVLMQRALQRDPLILYETLNDQFQKLIVGPVLAINGPLPRILVVIDALDECSDEALLVEVVRLLGGAFATARQLPFRFLLTSRPEEHIRNAFARPMTRSKTYSVALQDFLARDDIHAFLQSQFAHICTDQEVYLREVPRPWPSPAVLEELVEKSEGLFIYVSTLMKYVGQGDGLPDEKLEAVRRINPGIDPLYKQVLSAALQTPNSRRVMGTVMLLRQSLRIKALAQLLQLTPAMLRHALRGCHSILIIPDEDDEDIKHYHASLQDFLMDHHRSHDYFINPKQHETITQGCLHVMASGLDHNTISDDLLRYACQYWCHHFSARLSSGRVSAITESPFGLEVKDLVEKLMDEWLRSWMYNIGYSRNVGEVQHMLLSTSTQLKGISGRSKQILKAIEILNKVLDDLLNDVDLQGLQWKEAVDKFLAENPSQHPPKQKSQMLTTVNKLLSPKFRTMSLCPSDVYIRQLLPMGYGYPLFTPEPDENLPLEYQKIGISIGDVGVITPDGAFSFLFNICAPADDPVNSQGVPEGFEPVHLAPDDVISSSDSHPSVICSPSIQVANTLSEGAIRKNDVHFRFTASMEAAVLVLPEGTAKQDLKSLTKFRSHALKHAVLWYQFANDTLGREAPNGSLSLVTGCHKSTPWGLASIAESHSETDSLILKFAAEPVEASMTHSYSWETFSSATTVRTGRWTEGPVQNQCIFLRGFRLMANRGVAAFMGRVKITSLDEAPGKIILGDKRNYVPWMKGFEAGSVTVRPKQEIMSLRDAKPGNSVLGSKGNYIPSVEAFEAESVTVWPTQGMIPSVSPPLTSDNFVALQSQWEGGCVLSLHDSGLADDWLDHHYEHECLVNIRKNEIGGPIASMLSIDAPALTIFGSMSPQIIEMAGELAKLSGFPVTIRPVTEDPSIPSTYTKPSDPDGESSGNQINGQTNARTTSEHRPTRHDTSTQRNKRPGCDDHPCEQLEEEVGDENDDDRSYPPDPPAEEGDMRQREVKHDTKIQLKILVDGKDKGDFLRFETSVKFYPIPNEKESLDSAQTQPKIEAHIVRLKMLRSPGIDIDCATGSLGFIADQRSFLHFEDFVPLGHNEPRIRYTHTKNKQKQNKTQGTAGLSSGKPTATVTLDRAEVNSDTIEAAEDGPSPHWVVEPEATDENWNSDIMSYSTLNAKIYRRSQGTPPMANISNNKDLDAKYGISVEVAAPIRRDDPKVSFVYRHQIHCWIAVESKAKRRGIIVVAANYIPDIFTGCSLWIQEYPKLNMVHNHLEGNVEGDASPRPEQTSEGIFSFVTAITSKVPAPAPERSWSSRFPKMWSRTKNSQGAAGQDIPIHPHVCRGWDNTNLQWQKVVWPKLDCKLQPLHGESTAAWRLDWRSEDGIVQEPQGSSTGTMQ